MVEAENHQGDRMKIIDIPKPVEAKLKIMDNGTVKEITKEISFLAFLSDACDSYKPFASGPKQARQYDKIMNVIESINGENSVRFEDADFNILKAAIEEAQWVTPGINRAYIPFYDAIEKAQDVHT
jgi:hypothetical protein